LPTLRSDLSTKNDLKATKGGQMNNLIDIFCDVDDFCHQFLPVWEAELIANGTKKRRRQSKMTMSECITIVIAFHQSNHWDFKNFYICQG
jgi:hypothetical protein